MCEMSLIPQRASSIIDFFKVQKKENLKISTELPHIESYRRFHAVVFPSSLWLKEKKVGGRGQLRRGGEVGGGLALRIPETQLKSAWL